jgi:hypothetical protein
MRSRVAATAVLCALLSGCAVGGAGEDTASCVARIRFGGSYYSGHAAGVPTERLREPLTGAVLPGCNDHSGSHAEDESISVRRLDGVDPAVAVSTGDPAFLYVRDGADLSRLPNWLGVIGQPTPPG